LPNIHWGEVAGQECAWQENTEIKGCLMHLFIKVNFSEQFAPKLFFLL
jgi:hypothetical protein